MISKKDLLKKMIGEPIDIIVSYGAIMVHTYDKDLNREPHDLTYYKITDVGDDVFEAESFYGNPLKKKGKKYFSISHVHRIEVVS